MSLCLGAPAVAAEPAPIVLSLPTGQSIRLDLDPLTVTVVPAVGDEVAGFIGDFTLDLVLFECGSSLDEDGTVSCGLKGRSRPDARPSPAPTRDPVAEPGPPLEPAGPVGEPVTGAPGGADGGLVGRPAGAADPVAADGDEGAPSPGASVVPPVVEDAPAVDPAGPPAPSDAVTSPWSAAGHPEDVLDLGVAAFALIALVGSRGLARASTRRRWAAASDDSEGSVLVAEAEEHEFDPQAGGPGDRSRLWRFIAGWALLDRLSRSLPFGLARSAPLTARIATDGAALRAMFGAAWIVVPGSTLALGLAAAHDTGGYPVAPTLGITAALVVIATFDAAAGLTAVLGFSVGLLIWGPGDLPWTVGLRSYLGLAALWFAIPLIASTARPLRRTLGASGFYRWDRLGDGVIAALIAGWSVYEAVGAMPGLSGLDLPIAGEAGPLALMAIGAMLTRVTLEEVAAKAFPERLKVVEPTSLPEPTERHLWFGAVLRTSLFAFVAYPFVGPSWQFWVGVALYAGPELLAVRAEGFSNSERLYRFVPRGVGEVLVMLVLGSLAARGLAWALDDRPDELLRYGFVVLALPAFAYEVLALVGREGAEVPRSHRVELAGTLAVATCVAWVLAGW